MRIPRLFVDLDLSDGDTVDLDDRATHHVSRVLRLRSGDPVRLFNGRNGEYEAYLNQISRDGASAVVGRGSAISRESGISITLCQGIARGNRMDLVLQKSIELGVNKIIPVWTDRSTLRLDGKRLERRMQHWRGIIINACEQCGRNRIPEISYPVGLQEWLHTCIPADTKLVLDPDAGLSLSEINTPERNIILLTGPEGGLSDGEKTRLAQAGFSSIRLGKRILRTETASITAISCIQFLWGDLN